MSVTLHQSTVPVFVRKLKALSGILDKAAAHAGAKGFDPGILVNARLAPDMFPLSRQIQIASDAAKGAGARLTGGEVPSWPDTESTIPELQARIAKTIDYLLALPESDFQGGETRDVSVPSRSGEPRRFKGADYLVDWALPNFYFHIVTAYAILRHSGVDVGKADYLA